MIIRCKGCNGALEYSAEMGKMECAHCGNLYDVEEVSPSVDSGTEEKSEKMPAVRKRPTIKMQIARCTSCGAEMAVNSVEISSFCAYCGQAAVVEDRMEDCLAPDYIIPFRKSRGYAKAVIKVQLEKGAFVPKEIRNFEADRIRGIYVPFWVFEMQYHDKRFYKYHYSARLQDCCYEFLEGETDFHNLTMDASRMLNDDTSTRLEPFDLTKLKEFNPAYLAGFYADRFDVGIDEASEAAARKACDLFSEQAKTMLRHSLTAELVKADYDYKVVDAKYVLLPVWFLTFRYKNNPMTFLVNGQTGKIVGAVPEDKLKAGAVRFGLTVPLCILCSLIMSVLTTLVFSIGVWGTIQSSYLALVFGGTIYLGAMARRKRRAYKESQALTTSSKTNDYAKERQGR